MPPVFRSLRCTMQSDTISVISFFLNHFIYPEQTLAHASFHCLSSLKLYIEIAGSEYS